MQRRAAAIYAALFIVLAAGSYGMIASAHAPSVGIENPDQRLAAGESFSVGGTTYTVDSITPPESGGEGGSAGKAVLTYTDADGTYELEWAVDDEVTVDGEDYVVTVDNESEPRAVVLRHVVEATTTEIDGETYVATNDSSGEREFVPIDEYREQEWGEDATIRFNDGASDDFRGNETAVEVGESTATLTWTAPKDKEIRLTAGENTTIGPNTYVAHVETSGQNDALLLSTNTKAYAAKQHDVQRFTERVNGLWGIVIISGSAAVILLGIAYLPVRRT